jgi:hypothetical protein
MNVLLLIAALVLVGIGIDIFRFPRLREMTQLEKEEYLFGKGPIDQASRNWMHRRTYFPRKYSMQFLAVILLLCGSALAVKALGII